MLRLLLRPSRVLLSSSFTSPTPLSLFQTSSFTSDTKTVRDTDLNVFNATNSDNYTLPHVDSSLNHTYLVKHPTIEKPAPTDVFAIVKLSGSQYKVTIGDVLTVNKVPDAIVGGTLELKDVLLVATPNSTIVGAPLVPNATVTLAVEEQKKDGKVIVFKKKRRQGYQRKNGARRHITVFRVSDIKYD